MNDQISMSETCKARAEAWFVELRDRICAAFEAIEDELVESDQPAGRFQRKSWTRPDETGAEGGGGTMSVMKGRVFEKVGVNVSTVYGRFSPAFAKEIPGAQEDPRFWASGISLVAHMKSPRVPAVHFNTRHIVTTKSWFGGGGDLNPTIAEQRTRSHVYAKTFHAAFKRACDGADPEYYDRFSKWCDEYFFNKHRNEARGVGGIFYDYLGQETAGADWEKNFAFTQNVGHAFLDAYPAIVRAAMNEPWTADEREEQLVNRGHYAEFNLVYDRGTKFGLMTGGNTDAILMSLPPEAKWP